MPAEVVRSKNAKKTLYFSDYLKTNKCSIVWSRRRTQSGYLDMHSCLDMSCFQSYICHDVQNAYAGKPLTCNWGERRQHGFAGDRRDLIYIFQVVKGRKSRLNFVMQINRCLRRGQTKQEVTEIKPKRISTSKDLLELCKSSKRRMSCSAYEGSVDRIH